MTAKEFLTNLPEKVNKEALEGKETIFHFDLSGERETRMTVKVQNGTIIVLEGLQGEPECVVRGKEKNFTRLIQGDLNPMMALMTGKIKVSNQSAMLKYAKMFGVM